MGYVTLIPTKKELKEMENYTGKHCDACQKPLQIELDETGIGTRIRVICGCKVLKDISDYTVW